MKKERKVQFRRIREKKTDYKARRALLESSLPRVVIRKTNRHIIAQIVTSREAQDSVVCSANSNELLEYGYASSLKNITAAYLTGFLIGLKAKKQKIKKAIIDIGFQRSTKGSKLYAASKGCIDAGMEIPHSAEIFPSEGRIKGEHLKKKVDLEKIKKSIMGKND